LCEVSGPRVSFRFGRWDMEVQRLPKIQLVQEPDPADPAAGPAAEAFDRSGPAAPEANEGPEAPGLGLLAAPAGTRWHTPPEQSTIDFVGVLVKPLEIHLPQPLAPAALDLSAPGFFPKSQNATSISEYDR
jgi:hypothetical protein